MKPDPTPAIFRVFLDGGDVIALFPFEPSDRNALTVRRRAIAAMDGKAGAR